MSISNSTAGGVTHRKVVAAIGVMGTSVCAAIAANASPYQTKGGFGASAVSRADEESEELHSRTESDPRSDSSFRAAC